MRLPPPRGENAAVRPFMALEKDNRRNPRPVGANPKTGPKSLMEISRMNPPVGGYSPGTTEKVR